MITMGRHPELSIFSRTLLAFNLMIGPLEVIKKSTDAVHLDAISTLLRCVTHLPCMMQLTHTVISGDSATPSVEMIGLLTGSTTLMAMVSSRG